MPRTTMKLLLFVSLAFTLGARVGWNDPCPSPAPKKKVAITIYKDQANGKEVCVAKHVDTIDARWGDLVQWDVTNWDCNAGSRVKLDEFVRKGAPDSPFIGCSLETTVDPTNPSADPQGLVKTFKCLVAKGALATCHRYDYKIKGDVDHDPMIVIRPPGGSFCKRWKQRCSAPSAELKYICKACAGEP